MIKEWLLIPLTLLSLYSIPITSIILIILSVMELIQNFQLSFIILIPLIGISVAIKSFMYEWFILSACDGLNSPGNIPRRTTIFLLLSSLNLIFILLLI